MARIDEECQVLESRRSNIQSKISSLSSELTDEKLCDAISLLQQEEQELYASLKDLDKGLPPVSPETKHQMSKKFEEIRVFLQFYNDL